MSIPGISAEETIVNLYEMLLGPRSNLLLNITENERKHYGMVFTLILSVHNYGYGSDGSEYHSEWESHDCKYIHTIVNYPHQVFMAINKEPHYYNVPLEEYRNYSNHDSCWQNLGYIYSIQMEMYKIYWKNTPEEFHKAPIETEVNMRFEGMDGLNGIFEFVKLKKEYKNSKFKIINLKRIDFKLRLCEQNKENMSYLDDYKRLNEQQCINLVKQNGLAIYHLSNEQKTQKVCLTAVRQNGYAIKHLTDIQRTQEVCLAAMHDDGLSILHLTDEQRTPEVCLAAVQQNGLAIYHLSNEQRTPPVCLAAVQQDGCAVEYLSNEQRTQEVCLAAVKQGGWVMKYLTDDQKDYITKMLVLLSS